MASAAVLPRRPGTSASTPRLRSATSADAGRLAALYAAARPNTPTTMEEQRTYLATGSALLVEDDSGATLAALRYQPSGDGWQVDPIATHPEQRGQGFGRWLMTMLEASAIRGNVPFLSIELTEPSVLPYYRRLGYRSSDERELSLRKRVGGVWQKQEQTR